MRYKKLIFLFSFVVFVSFAPKTFASTIIDADITENTTWTLANSPYVIQSSINVNVGATLLIDPGVIVKIDGGWNSIDVFGSIVANGTSASPIIFTSFRDDVGGDTNEDGESFPSAGDWYGIYVEDLTSKSSFSNTRINYSDGGLAFENTPSVSISNLEVNYFSQGGLTLYGNSHTVVHGFSSDGGNDNIAIFNDSSGDFTDVSIMDSNLSWGESVVVFNRSSLSIVGGTFKNILGDVFDVFNTSSLALNKVNISNISRNGMEIFSNANLTATELTVDNTSSDALIIFDDSSADLNNSSVTNNYNPYGGAVEVYDGSSFSATGSTFDTGIYDGIDLFSNTVGAKLTLSHSTVKNFPGSGIGDFGNNNPDSPNTISIDHSVITGNDVGIDIYNIAGHAPSIVNIADNFIYNNSSFGVRTFNDSINLPLVNNWWGDASGPYNQTLNPDGLGDEVSDGVSFDPWCKNETCQEGLSNVLFLPGIEASRLYEQKTVLGLPVEDQLWEPSSFLDIPDLYLNSNGQSKNKIYTRDIIDTGRAFGIFHSDIYKSLILKLNNLKSKNEISDWKPFAYDWRQGIDDLIRNGTKYNNDQVFTLIGTLQSLVDTSKTGDVTIVTHSNGGLLAKALIKRLEDMKSAGQGDLIDHIDNLVMVATPQLGTPEALSGLLHGYKQSMGGGTLLNNTQARILANNMSSAYGLLPSKKYFDQSGITFPGVFDPTSAQMYRTAYGSNINNYEEEHNFVLGQEGRTQPADSDLISPIKGNNTLLIQAENLHDSVDNMTFPSSLKVINIAGWGKSTIAGMTYTDSDIQPIKTIRGDETVVSQSASYGQGTKYWLDLSQSKLNHGNIFEDPQLLSFINNIIEQKSATFSNITDTEPLQTFDILAMDVHSPVSIGVYDNQENFTGKVCDDSTGNCTIEENIPGSTYLELGEGKYVNLGKGNFQKSVLQGTDVGTFTFNSQILTSSGEVTALSSFVDIPVTTQTEAEITLNQTGTPQLALDVTGDGATDFTLTPSTTFDPITYLQVMKATIDSLDLTKAQIKAFGNRVDNMIKSIQKGKIDKAKLKADRFKSVLEKKLAKPDPKHPKPKKLSKTDAQMLLDMLNKLLDNLS